MKKLLLLTLCFVLAMSMFTCCASGDAIAESEPTEEITLKLSIWGNDARKEVFEGLAEKYEEMNPGITVEVLLIPFAEYMQKVSIQIASNTAPNVIWLAEKMVPQFIESGNLVDLSANLSADEEYDLADFSPTSLDLFTRGEELYGIPFAFGPRVLFYNKTLFDQAGVKTPTELVEEGNWTLETMYDSAKQLTDKSQGIYGIKLMGATEPTAYTNALYDILLANGGDYFNDEMTEFTLNTQAGIDTLQMFYDMLYTDEIHPKPGDQTQFETGKIAIARDTFSYAANLRGNVDFEWDIVSAPTGPAAGSLITSGFANYSVTKGENEEEAIELLKYFTSKEVMMELLSTFPNPRMSILNSEEFLTQPDNQPSAESVKLAFVDPIISPGVKSYPAHENYQKIDVEMTGLFEMMFTNEYSVEEIIQMMEDKVNPLLK